MNSNRKIATAIWKAIDPQAKELSVKNRPNTINMLLNTIPLLEPTADEITIPTPLTKAVMAATGYEGLSLKSQEALLVKWNWMIGIKS